MKKYKAYIMYKEVRELEIEAEDERTAEEYARDHIDDAEPIGDDDYEIEIEELDEEDPDLE